MKQKYRIRSWRFDVPRETYSEPEFDGRTVEDCDKQAVKYFESVSAKPECRFDQMDIVRIDSPMVAEKITLLKKSGRDTMDDFSL